MEVAGLLVGQQRTRWNCVKPGPPGASGPCPCSATQRPWWWSQGPRGPRAWKPDPGPGDWAPTSWEISTRPRHSVSTEVLWPQGGPVPSWPGVLAVGRGFARGLVRICPGGSGPLQPAEGTGGSDRFGSTGPPCTPEGVPLGRGAESFHTCSDLIRRCFAGFCVSLTGNLGLLSPFSWRLVSVSDAVPQHSARPSPGFRDLTGKGPVSLGDPSPPLATRLPPPIWQAPRLESDGDLAPGRGEQEHAVTRGTPACRARPPSWHFGATNGALGGRGSPQGWPPGLAGSPAGVRPGLSVALGADGLAVLGALGPRRPCFLPLGHMLCCRPEAHVSFCPLGPCRAWGGGLLSPRRPLRACTIAASVPAHLEERPRRAAGGWLLPPSP